MSPTYESRIATELVKQPKKDLNSEDLPEHHNSLAIYQQRVFVVRDLARGISSAFETIPILCAHPAAMRLTGLRQLTMFCRPSLSRSTTICLPPIASAVACAARPAAVRACRSFILAGCRIQLTMTWMRRSPGSFSLCISEHTTDLRLYTITCRFLCDPLSHMQAIGGEYGAPS